MNILYYGYQLSRFGAPHQEMAAVYLARKYGGLDYICWGGESTGWLHGDDGVNFMPQPKKGLLSAVRQVFTLLRLVLSRKNDYDVVYVQGAQQTPFVFWLPFVKGGKKVVYHTQDYLEPRRHRFYERFEKWFSRHADYVVCNEPNRARFMKSYYGLEHMPAVVRTALPADWPIPERSAEMRARILAQAGIANAADAVVIVAGGTYRADRMSPQLLEAFSRLPDNHAIVFNGPDMAEGGGCRQACEAHMQALGLKSRVVCLGGLDFDELLALCSAGEVGVLLYPNDGVGHYYQCPGRFSEYLRCGLTLVSSNFMGLELLSLKHNLGTVCDSEDSESIAAALREAGRTAKANRSTIVATAEREFVYEKGAGVLDEIIGGTYEHPKPSVHT